MSINSDSIDYLSENDQRRDIDDSPDSINYDHSINIISNEDEESVNENERVSIKTKTMDSDISAKSTRRHNRTQTVELTEEALRFNNYRSFGRVYRQCCYSAMGIKITICLNLIMVLLNSGLIIYEIYLIIRDKSLTNATIPVWYIVLDFIITIILFIEILFVLGAIYSCSICKYISNGWQTWIDIFVLLLSIGCCIIYFFDISNVNIDNLTMLFIRVIRDIVRIIRCIWFFKMLYSNLIYLNIKTKIDKQNENNKNEPLLDDQHILQINSASPKSKSKSMQDDDHDIKKNGTHKRNVTRNADDYDLNQINQDLLIEDSDPLPAKSLTVPSLSVQNIEKDISKDIDVANSALSYLTTGTTGTGLSYLTTGTNMDYYEDLKLSPIKQDRVIDQNRLIKLLNNLPSESIVVPRKNSSDDDSDVSYNLNLHHNDDKITII